MKTLTHECLLDVDERELLDSAAPEPDVESCALLASTLRTHAMQILLTPQGPHTESTTRVARQALALGDALDQYSEALRKVRYDLVAKRTRSAAEPPSSHHRHLSELGKARARLRHVAENTTPPR